MAKRARVPRPGWFWNAPASWLELFFDLAFAGAVGRPQRRAS